MSLLATASVSAEVTVTISKTHLCCGACVKAVDTTLKDLAGVKHESNQDEHTISLKADSLANAQKAIDALAAAGFHGKVDHPELKYKPVDAPKGKVARLEISGIHNCCGACTKAIKAALKDVEGVQADTAKPKVDSFVVEGDFSPAAAVEALLNAGFHVSVKK
ncbi:MAG: cation transporter [Pirellulaceae bacterium]